jgi:hypothetical protein
MDMKTFNFIASMSAFVVGSIFVFSDNASITANVIGATGNDAGFTAMIGIGMIVAAIGLFIVSMHATDDHPLSLERLIRGNRHTAHNINDNPDSEDAPEMKK